MLWLYTLISVIIVSLTSFVGALYLFFKKERLEKILTYLVALSVGALLGDVFIHIIPEVFEGSQNITRNSMFFLIGILLIFIVEKYIHWHHCHHLDHEHEVKPVAYTNIVGDAMHNFLDGMIIAGSFLVSIPIGITTTIAVISHEIPHEIGNFGVLLYGGLAPKKALILNFLSGCVAIIGALAVLLLIRQIGDIQNSLLALAGGSLLYIAASDLIPELHKTNKTKESLIHLILMFLGIGIMSLLLFLE